MSYPRCIHFNGVQNVCAAGIDPMSKRDVSQPGMATFPCLEVNARPCPTSCESRRWMTKDEVDAETAQFMAAIDKYEADLKLGKCPHCQAEIKERQQVGRCQYARPCGHRLGQIGGDDGDE